MTAYGLSVAVLPFVHTQAGQIGSVVRGAEDAAAAGVRVRRGGLNVFDDLALVPDVVAGGDDVNAEIEQLFGDGGGDAEAAGRIFSVDDEINRAVFDQAGQAVFDDVASRTSENVADKKNMHDGEVWSMVPRKKASLVLGPRPSTHDQRRTTDD